MKNSFKFLTVAAFASVALIGCSSSNDDGGNTPPPVKPKYDKPDAKVELVGSGSDYLVYNVTNTAQKGKTPAELTIKAECNKDTDANNLVVDNKNNKIGYLKSATAAAAVNCTVSFDGETKAGHNTVITFNKAGEGQTTTKEVVEVTNSTTPDEVKDGNINFLADGQAHTFTFTTKAAAGYTKSGDELVKGSQNQGVKKIKLTHDLTTAASNITAACDTRGAGATTCDITITSSAEKTGKITATEVDSNTVEKKESTVTITSGTDPKPPVVEGPTAEIAKNTSNNSVLYAINLKGVKTSTPVACMVSAEKVNDGVQTTHEPAQDLCTLGEGLFVADKKGEDVLVGFDKAKLDALEVTASAEQHTIAITFSGIGGTTPVKVTYKDLKEALKSPVTLSYGTGTELTPATGVNLNSYIAGLNGDVVYTVALDKTVKYYEKATNKIAEVTTTADNIKITGLNAVKGEDASTYDSTNLTLAAGDEVNTVASCGNFSQKLESLSFDACTFKATATSASILANASMTES